MITLRFGVWLFGLLRNGNDMTELPRIENELKLCYSKTLDCKICFDSGSAFDYIPSSLLKSLREKGFPIEEYKTDTDAVFSDGSSEKYNHCYLITLPLSPFCLYRYFFLESKRDYILLGRRFLKKYVIVYHRDKIILQDNHPEEFNVLVPIEERDGSYFVKLSINGRENDYYLDTGHSDAVTLPLEDKQYAISPLKEEKFNLSYLTGVKKLYKEIIEDRGLLEIGGISKHGPIDYADYYKRPYWFNPVIAFADFMVDLKNNVLGLIKK